MDWASVLGPEPRASCLHQSKIADAVHEDYAYPIGLGCLVRQGLARRAGMAPSLGAAQHG